MSQTTDNLDENDFSKNHDIISEETVEEEELDPRVQEELGLFTYIFSFFHEINCLFTFFFNFF